MSYFDYIKEYNEYIKNIFFEAPDIDWAGGGQSIREHPERDSEIAAMEKFKVKACGGDMELTYIGNGLSERLKLFGIEGDMEK
jgi:hypothetical protein